MVKDSVVFNLLNSFRASVAVKPEFGVTNDMFNRLSISVFNSALIFSTFDISSAALRNDELKGTCFATSQ
jgi:hypothetical protein